MSHPTMFDAADPVLARLAGICLALPGTSRKVTHGRPAFLTRKIFAVYGAVVKGDPDRDRFAQSVVFLPDPDESVALAQDARFFVPAYWGPYGWRGLDLRGDVDWGEVAELLEDSYRNTAPASLVAQLDTAPP